MTITDLIDHPGIAAVPIFLDFDAEIARTSPYMSLRPKTHHGANDCCVVVVVTTATTTTITRQIKGIWPWCMQPDVDMSAQSTANHL